MTQITHVEVTAEPAEFYDGHGAGYREFAAHLAPDIQGLSVDDSRSAFKSFLDAAPDTEFLLITVDANLAATGVEDIAKVPLKDADKTGDHKPFDIYAWLQSRAKGTGDETAFWTTGGDSDELDLRESGTGPDTHFPLTASQLLRGSLNWPGPLPQRAGLVHVVRHQLGIIGVGEPFFLVVPKIGDTPDPNMVSVTLQPDSGASTDKRYHVTYDRHVFSTNFLENPAVVKRFRANGWIEPSDQDTKLASLHGKVRSRIGRMFDPLPVLTGFIPSAWDADTIANYTSRIEHVGQLLLFDQIEIAMRNPKGDGRVWETLRDAWDAASGASQIPMEAEKDWLATPTPKALLDLLGRSAPEAEVISSEGLAAEDEAENKPALDELESVVATLNKLAADLSDQTRLEQLLLEVLDVYLGSDWMRPFGAVTEENHQAAYNIAQNARANFAAHYASDLADATSDLNLDVAGNMFMAFRADLPDQHTKDQFISTLTAFDWMSYRLQIKDPANAPTGLKEVLDKLLAASLSNFIEDPIEDPIVKHFDAAHKKALGLAVTEDFQPDTAPQPLPISVTSGFQPEEVDKIMSQITGFGVVIAARRPGWENGFEESASHVNVASLWPKSPNNLDKPNPGELFTYTAIEPMTLTDNFGLAEVFLRYDGVPQIGRHVAVGGPDAALEHLKTLQMPYKVEHGYYDDGLHGVPPLAYGYQYSANAFYIPNSGRLPRDLRATDSLLLPGNPKDVPYDEARDLYLRTTAVSEVALNEGPVKRIGQVPNDVFPIAPELFKSRQMDRTETAPPVLLVAQNKPDEDATKWTRPFTEDASFYFSVPRVTYEDFERWVLNPSLRNRLAKGSNRDPRDLGTILRHLALARDAFEDAGDQSGFELMNRLPDPAVSGLEVKLTVFDHLFKAHAGAQASHVVSVHPYQDLSKDAPANYGDLQKLVQTLNKALTIQVTVQVSDAAPSVTADGDGILVNLRPGDLSHLQIRPLIETSHSTKGGPFHALDARLLRNPEDQVTFEHDHHMTIKCNALPGAELLVEAMQLPDAATLQTSDNPNHPPYLRPEQRAALQVKTKGLDRRYTYELAPIVFPRPKPQHHMIYRAFSHVDQVTQRWRPTGRPIYRWIDPARFNSPNLGPVIEVPCSEEATDPVTQFENDAFYGRNDHRDGEVMRIALPAFELNKDNPDTPVRLDRPGWTASSATYFRHSQTFRSRYFGAVRRGVSTVLAARLGDHSHRVAILADASGGHVNAPNVRQILPALTGTGSGTLPFVCTLTEKPFDQYGLADRIVAGAKTIRHFTLPDTLKLQGFRKEVGPEPRAAIAPVPDAQSRGVTVRSEGPVGRHFDDPTAQAPGFVNSSYLLHVDGLDDDKTRVPMFVGTFLKRYADPGWTWTPPRPLGKNDPLPDDWWLDLDPLLKSGDFDLSIKDEDEIIVKIEPSGRTVDIKIRRDRAYPDGGVGHAPLCSLEISKGPIVVINQKREEGRYTLTVLQTINAADRNAPGQILRPQLVAEMDYQAQTADNLPRGTIALVGASKEAARKALLPFQCGQSTATLWTRSAYDMSTYAINGEPRSLEGVQAKVDNNRLSFQTVTDTPLSLGSRDALINHPLSVHTYLAAVTLKPSKNFGRQIYLPDTVALLSPAGDAAHIDGTDVAQVALLGFESNAEPVLANGGNDKSATFDLDAHRATSHSLGQDMLFRMRFFHAPNDDNLTITIKPSDVDGPGVQIELKDLDMSQVTFLTLRVTEDLTKPPQLRAFGIGEEIEIGSGKVTVTGVLAGPPSHPFAHVDVELSTSIQAELGADISLLPNLGREPLEQWTWDWVFPPQEGGADLDTAVQAQSLNRQAEAVLVPLGVSDTVAVTG